MGWGGTIARNTDDIKVRRLVLRWFCFCLLAQARFSSHQKESKRSVGPVVFFPHILRSVQMYLCRPTLRPHAHFFVKVDILIFFTITLFNPASSVALNLGRLLRGWKSDALLILSRLDLIPARLSHPQATRSHPYSTRSHPRSARFHPRTRQVLMYTSQRNRASTFTPIQIQTHSLYPLALPALVSWSTHRDR